MGLRCSWDGIFVSMRFVFGWCWIRVRDIGFFVGSMGFVCVVIGKQIELICRIMGICEVHQIRSYRISYASVLAILYLTMETQNGMQSSQDVCWCKGIDKTGFVSLCECDCDWFDSDKYTISRSYYDYEYNSIIDIVSKTPSFRISRVILRTNQLIV